MLNIPVETNLEVCGNSARMFQHLLIALLWASALNAQNIHSGQEGRRMRVPSATIPASTAAVERTPISPSRAFSLVAPTRILLPAIDEQTYREADQRDAVSGLKKVRAGIVRPVALGSGDGEWTAVAAGWVWRLEIRSLGAKAMRAHFRELNLPSGGELFAYNPEDSAEPYHFLFGSSAEPREWWTELSTGETLRLEILIPSEGRSKTSFNVGEIAHLYRAVEGGSFAAAGSCNLDAKCYPEWIQAGDAVVQLRWSDSQFFYLCSGVLVNNAANDFSPLVLTANHCISNESAADGLQFSWRFRSTSCGANSTVSNSSLRGNLEAAAPGDDMTLLSVSGSLPTGLTFAGWNVQPVTQGADITGIHHPEGSYQRISFGKTTNGVAGAINVQWNQGITEPGSSGSPLFNSSREVLGTLTGGTSSCSNPAGGDYYGSLAGAYPVFAGILENGLPDDQYEPNNTAAAAKALPATDQTLSSLVLKYQDEDWFTLVVPAKTMLQLAMKTVKDEHDWRADIYTADGNTLLKTIVIEGVNDLPNPTDNAVS
jgi:lysyl endopeptidase